MTELRNHLRDLDLQLSDRNRDLIAANADLRRQIADRKDAEERFRSAFETTPLPLCIVNLKTMQWVDSNAAFSALAGWSHAELIDQKISVNSFWSKQPADLLALLATTKDVIESECHFLPRSGDERCVLFSRKYMTLQGQTHVLLQINDVTKQRNAEEQKREGMKLEAIGRLAAGVAHDFNNILTVIKGHASLLLGDEKLPAQCQRAVEQMADASRRATGLVRQLLAFGKQQTISPKAIDVGQHVDSESKMLKRLIGEQILLRWEAQPAIPAAMVDPSSLDQILLNLIVNARDAMPKGGSISISTCTAQIDEDYCASHPGSKTGDYILIKVSDTGMGIPLEIQSRIFEPFFSTKGENGGTGLGLATVYGLVQQQNGWLELDSKPGNGSTFSIYLPQATGAAETQAPSTRPLRANDWKIGGGRAALIIEDDEAIRMVLGQLLSRFGFDILEASNGMQALDIWQQKMNDIQLVITDVVMPGTISGLDLGQRITADKPRVKIIYCTGYSAEMLSEKNSVAMVEGENFLAKPYDAQSLLQILNRLFPKKQVSRPMTNRMQKSNGQTVPLLN